MKYSSDGRLMDNQAGQLTRGGGYEEYLVAAGGGPTPRERPYRVKVRKKLKIVTEIVLLFVYEILCLSFCYIVDLVQDGICLSWTETTSRRRLVGDGCEPFVEIRLEKIEVWFVIILQWSS